MKLFIAVLNSFLLATPTGGQAIAITRAGFRPIRPAPAENFTGRVQVEMLFEAAEPSYASGGSVTFEPGARTAWHSHPGGQVLIVTAGFGTLFLAPLLVQSSFRVGVDEFTSTPTASSALNSGVLCKRSERQTK